MAEKMLAAAAAAAGVEVSVASSGVSDEEYGNPLDRRAARELQRRGYPLGSHSARQITIDDMHKYDLVLAMTANHYRFLEHLAEAAGCQPGQPGEMRLEMFRIFQPDVYARVRGSEGPWTAAGAAAGWWRMRDLDVPDPWYGGPQDFVETADTIEECLPQILEYLEESA